MRNHELECRFCPDCKIKCKDCKQHLNKELFDNHKEACELQVKLAKEAKEAKSASAAVVRAQRVDPNFQTYFKRVYKVTDHLREESMIHPEKLKWYIIGLIVEFLLNCALKLLFVAKLYSIYHGYYLPSYGGAFIIFSSLYFSGTLFGLFMGPNMIFLR